jgi:hypothetical protein
MCIVHDTQKPHLCLKTPIFSLNHVHGHKKHQWCEKTHNGAHMMSFFKDVDMMPIGQRFPLQVLCGNSNHVHGLSATKSSFMT